MLRTSALPPGFALASPPVRHRARGEETEHVPWTPSALAALVRHLDTAGTAALASLGAARIAAAWSVAIEELYDSRSAVRQALAAPLAARCRLSPAGLDAGLTAVLGGVRAAAATPLFRARRRAPPPGLAAVVLSSNLPALAVQPLLPALAVGRPVLLKSATAEPLFAPALVAVLRRHEPRLADALAAVTWPGGDHALEAPVLAGARTIIAYGSGPTMTDLAARAAGKLVAYGPKLSLGLIGAAVNPETVAAGLARDIALFDQRGCLSIQAIYTAGDAPRLARALARALEDIAARWPPGPIDPGTAAQVQQLRADADMRRCERPETLLRTGTVIVEPTLPLRPSPGLRTVRIHALAELSRLPPLLAPWNGRLQGVAMAGEDAEALAPALHAAGASRLAPPGTLQAADASWHNGGLSPLDALAGRPA